MKAVSPDTEKEFLIASWDESMKVMSESAFLQKIVRYPTDSINAEMIDFMVPYLRHP